MATDKMRAWLEEKIARDTEWLKHIENLEALDVDETSPSYSETKYNIGIYQAILAALEPKITGECYPPDWKHCMIHLNPKTGEMHSDGDHSVRTWVEDRIKLADATHLMKAALSGPGEYERRTLEEHFKEILHVIQHPIDCAWCDEIRALILGHAGEGEKEEE